MGEGTDRLSRAPLRRCHARENDAREHHGDRWSGMDEAGALLSMVAASGRPKWSTL